MDEERLAGVARSLRGADPEGCLEGVIAEALGIDVRGWCLRHGFDCAKCTGAVLDALADALDPDGPDTQARIDADVEKPVTYYWGCEGANCDACPSKVDGAKPYERYKTGTCARAKVPDLLRRQRELDARKGGAA